MDLALNNVQRLICHKTQPTKPTNLAITEAIENIRFANGESAVDQNTIIEKFRWGFQNLNNQVRSVRS